MISWFKLGRSVYSPSGPPRALYIRQNETVSSGSQVSQESSTTTTQGPSQISSQDDIASTSTSEARTLADSVSSTVPPATRTDGVNDPIMSLSSTTTIPLRPTGASPSSPEGNSTVERSERIESTIIDTTSRSQTATITSSVPEVSSEETLSTTQSRASVNPPTSSNPPPTTQTATTTTRSNAPPVTTSPTQAQTTTARGSTTRSSSLTGQSIIDSTVSSAARDIQPFTRNDQATTAAPTSTDTPTSAIEPVSFTDIPTIPTGSSALGGDSFFNNRAAVAGVFAAVAVVALVAVSFCAVFICRRRSQHERRRQPRFSFQRAPPSNDVFRREDLQPAMTESRSSYIGRFGDDPSRHLVSPSLTSGVNRSSSMSSHVSGLAAHSNYTANGAHQGTTEMPYEGPFSDYHAIMPTVPPTRYGSDVISHSDRVDVFKDLLPEPPSAHVIDSPLTPPGLALTQRPPSAESSPSVYPVSLSPVPEESHADLAFYEQQTRRPIRALPPAPTYPPPKPPTVVINPSTIASPLNRVSSADVETPQGDDDPFSSPLDLVYETGNWWNSEDKGKGKAQPSSPSDSQFSQNSRASSTIFAQSPPVSCSEHETSVESSHVETKQNPFHNSFLGRPVSGIKKSPLMRPQRSPLRPNPPTYLGVHTVETST